MRCTDSGAEARQAKRLRKYGACSENGRIFSEDFPAAGAAASKKSFVRQTLATPSVGQLVLRMGRDRLRHKRQHNYSADRIG